jgi:hypothetical protein
MGCTVIGGRLIKLALGGRRLIVDVAVAAPERDACRGELTRATERMGIEEARAASSAHQGASFAAARGHEHDATHARESVRAHLIRTRGLVSSRSSSRARGGGDAVGSNRGRPSSRACWAHGETDRNGQDEALSRRRRRRLFFSAFRSPPYRI